MQNFCFIVKYWNSEPLKMYVECILTNKHFQTQLTSSKIYTDEILLSKHFIGFEHICKNETPTTTTRPIPQKRMTPHTAPKYLENIVEIL